MNRFCVLVVVSLALASCGGSAAPTSTLAVEATTSTSAPPTTTRSPVTTTATPTTTTTAPATTTVAPTTTSTTTTTTTTTTVAPTTTTAAPTTTTTAAPTTTTTTTTAAPTTTTSSIDYVAMGAQLATDNGCRNCHSTDGTVGIGPSWAGLVGSTVSLEDGSTVTANNSYLVESIKTPDAKIVAGFAPGVMQIYFLSDEEIRALVAYISSR